MTVVLIISLLLLFIIVMLVVYKTYIYIRGRQEETETTDLLTNLLPFIKSVDEGKEYSLI